MCPFVIPAILAISLQWLQQIEVTESALQQKMVDLENEKVVSEFIYYLNIAVIQVT